MPRAQDERSPSQPLNATRSCGWIGTGPCWRARDQRDRGPAAQLPEPHVAAAGALAAATRANAEQIAEVTLASVARVGATLGLSQEGAGDRGSWFRR
jgi:hypothetical protein